MDRKWTTRWSMYQLLQHTFSAVSKHASFCCFCTAELVVVKFYLLFPHRDMAAYIMFFFVIEGSCLNSEVLVAPQALFQNGPKLTL